MHAEQVFHLVIVLFFCFLFFICLHSLHTRLLDLYASTLISVWIGSYSHFVHSAIHSIWNESGPPLSAADVGTTCNGHIWISCICCIGLMTMAIVYAIFLHVFIGRIGEVAWGHTDSRLAEKNMSEKKWLLIQTVISWNRNYNWVMIFIPIDCAHSYFVAFEAIMYIAILRWDQFFPPWISEWFQSVLPELNE